MLTKNKDDADAATILKSRLAALWRQEIGHVKKFQDFTLCACDLTGFRSTHILRRHKAGAGLPGKAEFPRTWDDAKILIAVSDVATDPGSVRGIGKYNIPYAIGTREGVIIRVDFYPLNHPEYAGYMSTAYPTNTTPN